MTKYIIIGFTNPSLETSKADIKVLIKNDIIGLYWIESNYHLDMKSCWLKFDTREEADKYIKDTGLENCISYGIEV